METQYYCKNEMRKKVVKNPKDKDGNPIIPTVNGIDYLEVTSADQKNLEVHFLHILPDQPGSVPATPAPKLTKENIIIEGGVRIQNIIVLENVQSNNNILTVLVNEPGDFSLYTLRIVNSPTDLNPPTGFDPQLSSVDFSFKVNCPSDFDCKAKKFCPTKLFDEPSIDYLNKDYASFRRLMLDRLSNIMPDWKERNTADLQVALVDILAYVGDHLSYYQDAVATEAYLWTARRRISARRHARLLDYFVHDGCNARTWIHFEVEKDSSTDHQSLNKGTVLLTKGPENVTTIASSDLSKALNEESPLIFETKHDLKLHSSHNQISFYTWSDSECCLPIGSTKATLINDPVLLFKDEIENENEFPVLIFKEIYNPKNGKMSDADPLHRHAVRLKDVESIIDPVTNIPVLNIEWYEEDALPFPLCLTAKIIDEDGTTEVKETSVAYGNVILADHGMTLKNQYLVPNAATGEDNYRPYLEHSGITNSVYYNHETSKLKAAAYSIFQDPHEALPEIYLKEGEDTWIPQKDLLGSDRFATEFVVETESEGNAQIRFGDDILGKKPLDGFKPLATYRIGNGRLGNVGIDSISRIVWDLDGIKKVRNPLPAIGGKDAETIEEIKQYAPQAFRKQERAVTESDYAEKTQLHPEVQRAVAKFRWTGSWYTVFIIVDRKGGLSVDAEFSNELRSHLAKYRLAGYDLEIKAPIFIPLDIILNVCVKPGYFRSHVMENLLRIFSRLELPEGKKGFFHPDNFSFGQPVYLSAIYQKAMDIAGVASLEVKKFQRWAKRPNNEKENGYLNPAELEIIRLDNDPNFPENGKIDFLMHGGL